jgi:hypothetical protein
VERRGCFPSETTIVHVGDRGADLFPFFHACQARQPRHDPRSSKEPLEVWAIRVWARADPSRRGTLGRDEARLAQSAARLIRWLGLLSPLAVRLLQWRDLSRRQPECPAHRLLDADLLAVVAAQVGQAPAGMTTEAFWKAVAQMGGYLARHGDGPAGWKTRRFGWLRVQTLLEGVHLASHLRL